MGRYMKKVENHSSIEKKILKLVADTMVLIVEVIMDV